MKVSDVEVLMFEVSDVEVLMFEVSDVEVLWFGPELLFYMYKCCFLAFCMRQRAQRLRAELTCADVILFLGRR